MKIETVEKKHLDLYWGAMPLPTNTSAMGVVSRDMGDVGILLLMHGTGLYAQGNAGAIRSLPQGDEGLIRKMRPKEIA